MNLADFAAVVLSTFAKSVTAGDALAPLFGAIGRPNRFLTTRTLAEVRRRLDLVKKIIDARDGLHCDLTKMMGQLEPAPVPV